MELNFIDYALTIEAKLDNFPSFLLDEILFLTIKKGLIEQLADSKTIIKRFSYAPDNTADGQDELLTNGIFFRIIAYEKNIGVNLDSKPEEILKAFHNLVSSYNPFWTTPMIDTGKTKKEYTIELLYQDVFEN